MKELYKFEKLSNKLDNLGYLDVTVSRFKVVKKDLTAEDNKGNIRWALDGVYLMIDGVEHKGYMYIKEPLIEKYDHFPKFHVTECTTIIQQKNINNFNGRYFWHNSNIVDLVDFDTGKKFNNVVLDLCSNCRTKANISNYRNTEGFYNLLDIQTPLTNRNENAELDIYGYTKDWQRISKLYRTKVNFTCENCKIIIINNYDKRFLEVHHKNGDKLNNSDINIECLCVLCHSKKDKKHEENFSKKNSQLKIKSFITLYKMELIKINNPFIEDYLKI